MKQILIVREIFADRSVGQIEKIIEKSEAGRYNGNYYNYMDFVDLDESFNNYKAYQLQAAWNVGTEEWDISLKDSAAQEYRLEILDLLRKKRQSLLDEADYLINYQADNAIDTTNARAWRQNLRDVTNSYKNEDGSLKASIESVDIANFTFPAKP